MTFFRLGYFKESDVTSQFVYLAWLGNRVMQKTILMWAVMNKYGKEYNILIQHWKLKGLIVLFSIIPGNFLPLYSHILFLRVFTAFDFPVFVTMSVICSCAVVYGSLDMELI
jgi:hypothetical protein